MNGLLVMPVALPLLVACMATLLWRSRRAQRAVSVAGACGLVIAAIALLVYVQRNGVIAVQMGGYQAPFGITVVADLFAAIMVLLAAMKGLAVVLYSLTDIDHARETYGYHPLLHVLLMGICGAFLTGDIFNLYVFFEIMLMSSFVLLSLGGQRGQLEGAIKYVTLNLISSAFFLAGVGILYGVTGTLNMADLAVRIAEISEDRRLLMTALAMMFLVAFGIKAAIFPLFFWLPASYHTPPAAISAIFAGLLTKVGVYALIRVFTLIFVHDTAFTHTAILVLAAFTMVVGVLGAAIQQEFRRILSFHIISQIGYMILGLGMAMFAIGVTPGEANYEVGRLAMAGAVFYILHHIVVKTNLFLVSGVVERLQGTGRLEKLGGFYRTWPALSVLFLVPAMSLAGVPPLSGFWAKFILVKAALQVGDVLGWVMAAVALMVGLLTLYSMTKIWAAVFWSDAPEGSPMAVENDAYRERQVGIGAMIAPIAGLAMVTVAIGLFAGPIFGLAMEAADQLLRPEIYIEAVGPAAPQPLEQLDEVRP